MIDFIDYSDLCIELTKWAKAYSNGGTSPVSDDVYDEAYKKLKQFERSHPDMVDKDSPTQKIVGDNIDGFEKVQHDIFMGSITNSNNHEELRNFSNDMAKKGCPEQTIEFKIDGLALSLKYENGELQDAVTRGDGHTGDRVYANALQIEAIPKNISLKSDIEIRGEVVWNRDDFNAWNKKLEEKEQKLLSNPRNGASGKFKSKNPEDVKDAKLSFVAYAVVKGGNDKHSDDMKWLKKEGFTTSDFYICSNTDEIISRAVYMETQRDKLPYLIDGLVIKVNDKTSYKRLGSTAKAPRSFSALKFKPVEKVTKLLSIEDSYSRTGIVCPVAIVKEVELALTNVNRSTLFNWSYVSFLGLYEGCEIIIKKGGEIIPDVVSVVGIDNRTKEDYKKAVKEKKDFKQLEIELHTKYKDKKWYTKPEYCAHCNTKLKYATNRSGEILTAYICSNPSCPIKKFQQIVKFVSAKAMNIYGISESVIEKLIAKGYIKDITDLYKVTKDQLLTLDSFGERSADKFLIAINISRNNYMHQFLAGVGIPNLGTTSSNILAEHFGDLESFHQAQKAELLKIDGIGDELVENIIDFRKDGGNRYLFRWFIDNNICTKSKPVKQSSDKLKGLTFIMTGKFDGLDRTDFKNLVSENGGKISSGITNKVDFVLFGTGAGPAKAKKIIDLQNTGNKIKKISDREFLEMLK